MNPDQDGGKGGSSSGMNILKQKNEDKSKKDQDFKSLKGDAALAYLGMQAPNQNESERKYSKMCRDL